MEHRTTQVNKTVVSATLTDQEYERIVAEAVAEHSGVDLDRAGTSYRVIFRDDASGIGSIRRTAQVEITTDHTQTKDTQDQGHPRMKAAIAIDPWKLDTFQRRLTQAGYTFESYPNGELTILQVTTDNMEALACVAMAANAEAARTGAPQ